MNKNEEIVKKKYEKLGYTVVHNGAPDLLCFKYDSKLGTMTDIIFVEVKNGNDKLSKLQWVWKIALESLRAEYHLEHPNDTSFHKDHYFDTHYTRFQCDNCKRNILVEREKILEKLRVMNRFQKNFDSWYGRDYKIDELVEDIKNDKRLNKIT